MKDYLKVPKEYLNMTTISYEDWKKLDLRIAKIMDVQEHPKADRLYIIKIDLGTEQRTLVAGLREHYTKEELLGKKVVVFVNLAPVELRGIKSEGMILAAVDKIKNKVCIIGPEKETDQGAVIQ